MTTRADGRADDELRPITITRHWLDHAAGSVLIEFGKTRVLCAASASEGVPRWRKGSGLGWVTAEYAMLPAATNTRSDRESVRGRIGGRTHEISRLIGRSLRAVIDYKALGENTIVVDCDVLQADGGTRTAAITGAYVALSDAITHLRSVGALKGEPLTGSSPPSASASSTACPRLDLPYEEDVRADTDMNVVMTGDGRFIEVQGTAEAAPFDRAELDALLGAGGEGLRRPDPPAVGGPVPVSRIFLASRNRKKIVEMERLLREYAPDVEVLGIDDVEGYDEPVEDQPTFEGNALLKARAGFENTGLPSLADDSGLCVDALNGMPGVLSARWAGAPRRERRSGRTSATTSSSWPSSPTSPMSAAAPTSRARSRSATRVGSRSCTARMSGHVIREQRGSGGFGYDVLFVADEHADAGLTSAELSPEEKDAVSHRGRALREIAPRVARVLGA